MTAEAQLERFGRAIGVWTLALTVLAILVLFGVGLFRIAPGVIVGAALMVGDIYLLRAPIGLMTGRVARNKRPWILALTLGRMVLLGAALLLLIKFHVVSVLGLFIGVTLPIPAIVIVMAKASRGGLHLPAATARASNTEGGQ